MIPSNFSKLSFAILAVGVTSFIYISAQKNGSPASSSNSAHSESNRLPPTSLGTLPALPDSSASNRFEVKDKNNALSDIEQAAIEDYNSELEEGKKYHQAFSELENLSSTEQDEVVADFIQDIDSKLKQNYLSAAEANFLKLALMKKTLPEDEFNEYANKLLEKNKKIAQKRHQEYLNNRPPEFNAFKEREAAIIEEVLLMETYPDGLSQEAYLAQRLSEARASIYEKTQ